MILNVQKKIIIQKINASNKSEKKIIQKKYEQ